jgi:hypothetical protein
LVLVLVAVGVATSGRGEVRAAPVPQPSATVLDVSHRLPASVKKGAFEPIPCVVLLEQAKLKGSDPVDALNVGRLFGVALLLRGAAGGKVPESVFDAAYADVLNCFSWQ